MSIKFKIYIQDNSDPADADMEALGLNYTRVHALEGGTGNYLAEMSGWIPKQVGEALKARLVESDYHQGVANELPL